MTRAAAAAADDDDDVATTNITKRSDRQLALKSVLSRPTSVKPKLNYVRRNTYRRTAIIVFSFQGHSKVSQRSRSYVINM